MSAEPCHKVPQASTITKNNILDAYVPSERHPTGNKNQRRRIEEIGHLQIETLFSLGAVAPDPVIPVAIIKKKKTPHKWHRRNLEHRLAA